MKTLQSFLRKHWDKKSPLLLGYSGGPDSKALLYLLLEAGCRSALHVAHVDHGWRVESEEEARQVQEEIERLGLPFHTTRLSPETKGGNREDLARKKRFAFFRSLFQKIPFQALLLAHQAEDLAETVLKRIFEGADLPRLWGMKPISHLEGMPLWRPLLFCRKKTLLAFLAARNSSFFQDPTNQDPAYLRARMRTEMLPFLEKSFGKSIVDNLVLLSQRSAELAHSLEEKFKRPVHQGEWGLAVNCQGLERPHQRFLLRKSFGLPLPRTLLEPLLDALETKQKAPCKFFFRSQWLVAYQEWTFLLTTSQENALPKTAFLRKILSSLHLRPSHPVR